MTPVKDGLVATPDAWPGVRFLPDDLGRTITVARPDSSTGTLSLLVPEPGPFELKLPSPWKFVQWLDGKDKGAERVLELEVAPCVARVVGPDGESPLRRWANLTEDNTEVEVELASVTKDGGDPVKDQDLFVEVRFKNDTNRGKGTPDAPDADYRKERTVLGLSNEEKSDSNLTWKGKVKTNGAARASFKLFLGKGGGETCELKVGSTNTVEDATVTFETWRKLYVQYTHSDTTKSKAAWPAEKRQTVIDAYAEVFIDVEMLPDKVFPLGLQLDGRCGWYDAGELGGTAGTQVFAINICGSSWKALADKVKPADPEQQQLYINISACDLMFEVSQVMGSRRITKGAAAKVTVLGKDVTNKTDRSFGGLPDKPIYKSTAKYQVFGGRGSTSGQTSTGLVEIPKASLKVSSEPKADRGKLEITLPQAAMDALENDASVLVFYDVMLKIEGAGAEGVSDGKHSVILNHRAKGDASAQNTVIHEVGHAIGMAGDEAQLNDRRRDPARLNRLPDYKVAQHTKGERSWHFTEHGRWYNGRGHQGDHCAEGLGQKDYDAWGTLDGYKVSNIGSFKCVLYGQDQALKTPLTYCKRCKDMLLAMELWVGPKPKA